MRWKCVAMLVVITSAACGSNDGSVAPAAPGFLLMSDTAARVGDTLNLRALVHDEHGDPWPTNRTLEFGVYTGSATLVGDRLIPRTTGTLAVRAADRRAGLAASSRIVAVYDLRGRWRVRTSCDLGETQWGEQWEISTLSGTVTDTPGPYGGPPYLSDGAHAVDDGILMGERVDTLIHWPVLLSGRLGLPDTTTRTSSATSRLVADTGRGIGYGESAGTPYYAREGSFPITSTSPIVAGDTGLKGPAVGFCGFSEAYVPMSVSIEQLP